MVAEEIAVKTSEISIEAEELPADATHTPPPDMALADASIAGVDPFAGEDQAKALQSLRELCDAGLLPENLYQQNVAAIQRSTAKVQLWKQALYDKSTMLQTYHDDIKQYEDSVKVSGARLRQSSDDVRASHLALLYPA